MTKQAELEKIRTKGPTKSYEAYSTSLDVKSKEFLDAYADGVKVLAKADPEFYKGILDYLVGKTNTLSRAEDDLLKKLPELEMRNSISALKEILGKDDKEEKPEVKKNAAALAMVTKENFDAAFDEKLAPPPPKDIQAYLAAMKVDVDKEIINKVMAAAIYKGFSPDLIRSLIFQIAKEAGIDPADCFFHVQILLSIYVERGPGFLKNAKGLEGMESDPVKKFIRSLVSVYKIKTTQPGMTDITLVRMAAVFPEVVAKIIIERSTRSLPLCADIGDIPLFFKFPAGASLLPKDQKYFDEWFKWNKAFSAQINKNAVDEAALLRYSKAAYDSNIVADRKAVVATLVALCNKVNKDANKHPVVFA